jgi:hypothetical protein
MTVRAHKGKPVPKLTGKYYKFMLEKPPVGFDVLAPGPAASTSNHREPFVLMHTSKWRKQTRVVVPAPATAVDDARTPVDAPCTGTLAADAETTPERPGSPEEVTGLIERLSIVEAATNSDGGENGGGSAASGGGTACAQCGIHSAVLKRCALCLEVAYCSKE